MICPWTFPLYFIRYSWGSSFEGTVWVLSPMQMPHNYTYRSKCYWHTASLHLSSISVKFGQYCKNLGLTFNNHFRLNKLVILVVQSCFMQIRRRKISSMLSKTIVKMVIHGSISSLLDYCNLFYMFKLQRLHQLTAVPKCSQMSY